MMIWGRLYRALDLGSPYVILFGQLFRDPVTWWWVNHWMLLCRWMLPSLDPLLIGKAKYQTSLFSQTTWFFTLWDNKPGGGFFAGKLLKLRSLHVDIIYRIYFTPISPGALHGHHPTVPWATAPPGEEVVLFDHQTFSPLRVKMLLKNRHHSAPPPHIWPRNLRMTFWKWSMKAYTKTLHFSQDSEQ